MRLAIELADAGLLALPEEGEAAAPSPGMAIVDGETITIGREAAARARLTPRRLHNRFWHEISTENLGRPFGRRLRSADLAWSHLSELWDETRRGVSSVVLALSGGRSEAQLGLILGVARSAGLPVDGLVDAAVSSSAGRDFDGTIIHLDLELHRAVVSILAPGPRLETVLVSDRVGLAALSDTWLRSTAGLFLKTTRFDPFHSAESEQTLSDLLPAVLDRLGRRSSTTVTLTTDNRPVSIELDRGRVEFAANTHYRIIDDLMRSALIHRPVGLLLTARAAGLPGLGERLSGLTELETSDLGLAAAASGALQHADRIIAPGPSLPLVTDLGHSNTEPDEDLLVGVRS